MYIFYMDGEELPVAPSRMQTKIKNNNKVVNLINDGDINILKQAGLTEISFTAVLPQVRHAFARTNNPARYYLDMFERLKRDKQPFQFIVIRTNGMEMLFNTNITVSLEDYTIIEDAKNGLDVEVAISLKQYKSYGTKTIGLNGDNVAAVSGSRESNRTQSGTHTVAKGDTLWAIAKMYYNDGSKYDNVYQANKTIIDDANRGKSVSKYTIYAGQVFSIPSLEV